MANKMLVDATHPEETRVVVMHGNRVEEFDFESASRKQLRGNIYLAKVTRVEPSLQAAFVDYGGNRHGFLAFSEIHPDYYQIPVADRQALIEEESRAHRDADEEDERRGRRHHRQRGARRRDETVRSDEFAGEEPVASTDGSHDHGEHDGAEHAAGPDHAHEDVISESAENAQQQEPETAETFEHASESSAASHGDDTSIAEAAATDEPVTGSAPQEAVDASHDMSAAEAATNGAAAAHGDAEDGEHHGDEQNGEEEIVESVGGDDVMEEVPHRAPRQRRRQYKIQEVIKRRQVMLVQVVKEERGTKGAALTTYLSLAGRYSVLMPNTARGGGISRKITSSEDRQRLKEIAEELQVPEGMGVILRTAGASRSKIEVKRDFEYLLRLWETVRDFTLKATAPTLVYEEGSLVKRSIRDLYHKDIEEIVVEGEAAYEEAKEFMRMLMPSHVGSVILYRDPQPIFARYGIESQLDAMFSPTVQLKSGGYIVINQTEALVAIDVNSGRSTREHNIEDTALKTNSEAAAEIARQLRLRDLAGLIVIDFIDMDENRNNRSVERKLKESLKSDRARIQVGRISHFGLMEMSRQRIRTSVLESSTETCPHCGGTGHVRSVSSVALQLLRSIEELVLKGATHNLIVRTRSDVALYVLNHKRAHLRMMEERFHILIAVTADASITGQPPFIIDRGEQVMSLEQAKALVVPPTSLLPHYEDEGDIEAAADEELETGPVGEGEAGQQGRAQQSAEAGRRRRRGRRGRGGRGRGEGQSQPQPQQPHSFTHETAAEHSVEHEEDFDGAPDGENEGAEPMQGGEQNGMPREGEQPGEGERRRRRRGRRGGRRNRRGREDNGEGFGHREPHEAAMQGEPGQHGSYEPAQGSPFEPHASQPSAQPTPSHHEAAPQSHMAESAPGDAEASRRRSTVRERAPVSGNGGDLGTTPPAPPAPPSPPAETASAPASEDAAADKPRRGWWRRG